MSAGSSRPTALERAITAFSGETVRVQCAGRTDAGVHATGQVAHVDLTRDWPADTVRDALNAHLKREPVAVLAADVVPFTFNARFSALSRHYLYRILDRRPPPALDAGRLWHVRVPLDHERMHEAAQALVGRHDFTTFRAAECQADGPLRTLDRLAVARIGAEIRIEASARSFLHHQVRSMVGSLSLVGSGRWPAGRIAEILAARDRQACGPLAPAQGLYLTRVAYPSEQGAHEAADHHVEPEAEEDDGGGGVAAHP